MPLQSSSIDTQPDSNAWRGEFTSHPYITSWRMSNGRSKVMMSFRLKLKFKEELLRCKTLLASHASVGTRQGVPTALRPSLVSPVPGILSILYMYSSSMYRSTWELSFFYHYWKFLWNSWDVEHSLSYFLFFSLFYFIFFCASRPNLGLGWELVSSPDDRLGWLVYSEGASRRRAKLDVEGVCVWSWDDVIGSFKNGNLIAEWLIHLLEIAQPISGQHRVPDKKVSLTQYKKRRVEAFVSLHGDVCIGHDGTLFFFLLYRRVHLCMIEMPMIEIRLFQVI